MTTTAKPAQPQHRLWAIVMLLPVLLACLSSCHSITAEGQKTDLGAEFVYEQTLDKKDAGNYDYHYHGEDQGVETSGDGALSVTATAGKLIVNAAKLNSGKNRVQLYGAKGIDVTHGEIIDKEVTSSNHKGGGLFSRSRTRDYQSWESHQVKTSDITGDSVALVADRGDINAVGSNIVGEHGTLLQTRQGDITLKAGENTYHSEERHSKHKVGLMGSGGIGLTLGSRSQSSDNTLDLKGHTATVVGAIDGNVTIDAGGHYSEQGAIVHAGRAGGPLTKEQWLALSPAERARAGNVTLSAQSAELDVMRGEQKQEMNSRYKQTGITVNLSGALVNAAQMARKNLQHLGESDNARVKAMAAANTAWSSYKAIQAVNEAVQSGSGGTLINLSISGGSQHSSSHQKSREDILQSSQLTGDSGVYLNIRGKGENSTLNVTGSDLGGSAITVLDVEGKKTFNAAETRREIHSDQHSGGGGGGIAIQGGEGGGGIGYMAQANRGKGYSDGQSSSWRLSHIGGLEGHTDIGDGKTLLNGAQILGKSIEGNTRDLEIHSPQGMMDYKSKQNALSGSVLYGYGVAVNLDYQNTRVDAHEKTVNVESGHRDAVRGVQESDNSRIQALTGSIKQNDAQANSGQDKTGGVSGFYAGDDGYRIHNTGTTVLGGLITSTEKAEAEGKNSFSTDRLVREEIHNYSNYKGRSIALGVSSVLGGKTLGQEQDERFINVGDSGVGKTFGIGHTEKHKEGLTTGSINTANLTIHDDAGQRQLTGESAAEAAKNANRGITLEHVKERNGAASVSFDADKVTRDITSTAQVMQGFDGTTQGIKHDLRKQADAYRERGDEETAAKLDKLAIGVDMLNGGLTPADSALGTIANTAAPLASYGIGQYAKAHGSEGSAGHIAAHAALAALTSAANGGSSTDMATSAGTAAAAELAAPLVAKGFYGTSDSSKLTAEQKETLSSILGLAAAGTGAMTGNSATAYGASKAVGNAIDDNFLGMEDKTRKAEIIDKAYKYRGGAEKYFEDHPDDSQELVEIFRKDADSDNLKNTMESGKPLSEFEYYQLMAYGMDARAQDMRAQQKDKTVVMGDYQFLFQTPVPLKPGTAVMNNDLSFVTTNGDIQKVLKRLDKISKLPQEERLYHREEQSYLYAYTNVPGNGYLKNAYKAPVIDQNLKLTNDTLAATAGVAGAAALAETAPAQMAMAGYGGWQIGDGSRDIYQGEYKQGAKKLFWGTLDTAFVGTSQWARAGKLGTIATDTGTAYKAVDTGWNSIAYTKAKYDNFRAGKNAVFGAAEYANTGKLASAEYLDNSKYAAGALKTVDNTASGVAKINKAETVGGNTAKIGENTKLQKTDIGQQDEIHPDIANLGINTPKYNEKLNEYINYRKPGSFYAEQAKRNYSIGNLESFKTQIESARNNIPKIKGWEKAREGGNVAVGEIFIEGNTNYTSRVFAHSRVNNPRFGFIGGETENFTYKILPVTGGNAVPRLIDSEYKILNHVANKLGDDTTAKGRVIIFTEKPACESCLDVKQQFMKKYPNIEVIIMDNKGEIIKPRPKRK